MPNCCCPPPSPSNDPIVGCLAPFVIPAIIIGLIGSAISHGCQSSNDTQSSSSSTAQVESLGLQALPPAQDRIKTRIVGTWHGRFSNDPAVLRVRRRKGNRFWATLYTTGTNGSTALAIEGNLASNNQISMQETKVLDPSSSKSHWTLGLDVGQFQGDGSSIAGRGEDHINVPYSWAFSR